MQEDLYFQIKNIKNWTQHLNDFWVLHPSATRMGPLKTLYTNDKTTGKRVSSRKAWFCILYIHPTSDFYNLPHEDKLLDLGGDLFPSNQKAENIYNKLKPCISYVRKAACNKSEQHLIVLHDKLSERADVYRDNPYTLGDSKTLDDMIKNEPYLFKAVQACEDVIKESAKDGSLKGGGELSFMESGEMFD